MCEAERGNVRQQPDPADEIVAAWLRRELSRRHDDVLREPIPAELLKLLAWTG